MNSNLEKELYRAAARTFEDLSFMLPMPQDDDQQQEASFDIVASVAFDGPISGGLMVGVPRDLLPVLAANMLGEDAAVSEVQQLDALAEVANVTCGNLLPAIAGDAAVFDFEAPQVFESTLLAKSRPPTAQVSVVLDEGWAKLMLFIDQTTA